MSASSTEAVLCSDQFLEILDVNTENVFWNESLVTAMCPDHMDQAQDHLHTARELNYLSARHQFEVHVYSPFTDRVSLLWIYHSADTRRLINVVLALAHCLRLSTNEQHWFNALCLLAAIVNCYVYILFAHQ